jgi:hypothetical protein
MTGSVRALAVPDHGLILVLGVGFDDFPAVDFTAGRVAETGPDIVYLCSSSAMLHEALVILEGWDGPAPNPTGEAYVETEAGFSVGEVYVSAPFAERALSPVLPIGPAGRYWVRVDVAGRAALRELATDPDRPDRPSGVERFRVRFWPVTGGAA